jgi:hypothetical protein
MLWFVALLRHDDNRADNRDNENRLDFFESNSKRNNNNNKTLITVAPITMPTIASRFNPAVDFEFVCDTVDEVCNEDDSIVELLVPPDGTTVLVDVVVIGLVKSLLTVDKDVRGIVVIDIGVALVVAVGVVV